MGRTQSCGLNMVSNVEIIKHKRRTLAVSMYILIIGAHLKRFAQTDRANRDESRISALKPARFRWSCSGSAAK